MAAGTQPPASLPQETHESRGVSGARNSLPSLDHRPALIPIPVPQPLGGGSPRLTPADAALPYARAGAPPSRGRPSAMPRSACASTAAPASIHCTAASPARRRPVHGRRSASYPPQAIVQGPLPNPRRRRPAKLRARATRPSPWPHQDRLLKASVLCETLRGMYRIMEVYAGVFTH